MSTPNDLGIDRVIYVAMRADGVTGTGTCLDPYNCNGANDAARQSAHDGILRTIVQAGDLVVYYPNVGKPDYRTNGYSGSTDGFYMKEGAVYMGLVKGQTRIILHSLDVQPTQTMFKTKEDRNNQYSGILNLILDGNYSGVGATSGNSINALELNGDDTFFGGCTFINMYGHLGSGKENFTAKFAPWAKTTTTSANFTQPAVNSTVVISVASNSIMSVGDVVAVATGGWYLVTAKAAGNFTGQNLGYASSASPSATITSGAGVTNNQPCVRRYGFDSWCGSPGGDYCNGFLSFDDYGKESYTLFDNLRVFDYFNGTSSTNSFGGGTGDLATVIMRNCYAKNCNKFYYSEGPSARHKLIGCVARDITNSLFTLNGSSGNLFSDFLIDGCDFEINNNSHPQIKGAVQLSASSLGNINNIKIRNTRLRMKNSGAATVYGVLADYATGVDVELTIDTSLPCALGVSNPNQITRWDVRAPDGTPASIYTGGQSTLPTW